MGYPIIRTKILEYLSRCVGTHRSLTEISDALGIEPERVRNCINTMVRNKVVDFTVVQKGLVWKINSLSPPSSDHQGRTYAEVATLKDGAFLLKSPEGSFYLAKPLEI